MGEDEWWTSSDPVALLSCLEGRGSPRRWRLLACACCRRVWPAVEDPRSRRAVEVAERYAGGLATPAELAAAAADASAASLELLEAWGEAEQPVETSARLACEYSADSDLEIATSAGPCLRAAVTFAAADPHAAEVERRWLCHLIRDLFGNPFRLVRADSFWLSRNGGAAGQIAQAMYRGGGFADLPVLADALEEAGCGDADILGHCRHPAEHTRGCWVLDLLVGQFPGGVTCEESFEEKVSDFVRAFEAVFDGDWDYTCQSMGIDRGAGSTLTFLNTGLTAAEEREDWLSRGWLLQSYRELKRVMDAKGISGSPRAGSE